MEDCRRSFCHATPRAETFLFLFFLHLPTWTGSGFSILPGNHKSSALLNMFLFLQCLFAEVSVRAVVTIKVSKFTCCEVPPFPPPHSPALWTLHACCLSQPNPHNLPSSHIILQHRQAGERGRSSFPPFHLGVGVRWVVRLGDNRMDGRKRAAKESGFWYSSHPL